jgi:hypothetical protein
MGAVLAELARSGQLGVRRNRTEKRDDSDANPKLAAELINKHHRWAHRTLRLRWVM